jgi:site-specific DNA-cytosine methylase
MAAGTPCIDFSKAGRRLGLHGNEDGSVLILHVFRLLSVSGLVPYVILENVEGILERHGTEPPGIKFIIDSLISLGEQLLIEQ